MEDVFIGSSVGSLAKIKNKKLQELEQSTERLCTDLSRAMLCPDLLWAKPNAHAELSEADFSGTLYS